MHLPDIGNVCPNWQYLYGKLKEKFPFSLRVTFISLEMNYQPNTIRDPGGE